VKERTSALLVASRKHRETPVTVVGVLGGTGGEETGAEHQEKSGGGGGEREVS